MTSSAFQDARPCRPHADRWVGACILVTGALASGTTTASNAALQDLFFAACEGATSTLAERCAETPEGLGNLSGDSESSLNPSQALTGAQTAIRNALERAGLDPAPERGLAAVATEEGLRLDVGRGGFLLAVHHTDEQREAVPDGRERRFDASTTGGEIGFDYALDERWTAGVLATYRHLDLEFEQEATGEAFAPQGDAGFVEETAYGGVVFLAGTLGPSVFVDLSAGYETGTRTIRRDSLFQESTRSLPAVRSVNEADADASSRFLAGSAGWSVRAGPFDATLDASLTATRTERDAFVENDLSDSGLAMRIGAAEQDSLLATVGASIGRGFSTEFGVLAPYANLRFARELEDDPLALTASYDLDPNDNRLILNGERPDREFWIFAVGVHAVLRNGWQPYLDLSRWSGFAGVDRQRIQLGLRKEL